MRHDNDNYDQRRNSVMEYIAHTQATVVTRVYEWHVRQVTLHRPSPTIESPIKSGIRISAKLGHGDHLGKKVSQGTTTHSQTTTRPQTSAPPTNQVSKQMDSLTGKCTVICLVVKAAADMLIVVVLSQRCSKIPRRQARLAERRHRSW